MRIGDIGVDVVVPLGVPGWVRLHGVHGYCRAYVGASKGVSGFLDILRQEVAQVGADMLCMKSLFLGPLSLFMKKSQAPLLTSLPFLSPALPWQPGRPATQLANGLPRQTAN